MHHGYSNATVVAAVDAAANSSTASVAAVAAAAAAGAANGVPPGRSLNAFLKVST